MSAPTKGPYVLIPQGFGGPIIGVVTETGDQMNPTSTRIIAQVFRRGDTLKTDQANAHLLAASWEMREALDAWAAYDRALLSCANDPNNMASLCTVQGESLDRLYMRAKTKMDDALAKAQGEGR